MILKKNITIFMQIANRICDEIIAGKYLVDERIPSVREYCLLVEVNVNTVVRSYEYLQREGILYTKRGLGFFVSLDAAEKIIAIRHKQFIDEDLPHLFHEMKLLGISVEEVMELYKKYSASV